MGIFESRDFRTLVSRAKWLNLRALLVLALTAALTTVSGAAAVGNNDNIRSSFALKRSLVAAFSQQYDEFSLRSMQIDVGEEMYRNDDTTPSRGMFVCLHLHTVLVNGDQLTTTNLSHCDPATLKLQVTATGATLARTSITLRGWSETCILDSSSGEYICTFTDLAPQEVVVEGTWSAIGPRVKESSSSSLSSPGGCRSTSNSDWDGRPAEASITIGGMVFDANPGDARIGKGSFRSVFQCS